MSEVRKQRAYDGRCTVFDGGNLVISNLPECTADRLVEALKDQSLPAADKRHVGSRSGDAEPNRGHTRISRRPR